MGDKRVSIRTLPDGYRVYHYPPDEQHPEGRMDLIHDRSSLREKLAERQAHASLRHQQLKAAHSARIERKRTIQKAKGLPPEKSAI